MRKISLLLFLLGIVQITSFSQIIRGTILDKYNGFPIDYAAIYFNGTFVGTQSDHNGNFKLDISKNKSMPLTISALGYYSFTANDFSTDTVLIVYLTPKTFELKEVVVTADSKETSVAKMIRKANFELFKNEFLGVTLNAQKCEIINENDIKLFYNSDNDTLKAFSTKPILINNKSLGYKVTYYLDKFEYCKKDYSLILTGNIIFTEDLTANKTQKKIFERRRKSAYLGSKIQFFRALWENKLDSSGFTVKNDLNIRLNYFEFVTCTDSLTKYLRFQYSPLRVTYYPKRGGSILNRIKDYVYFDKNGYYDGLGISLYGEFAKQRIADWLPYEYYIK